MNLRFRIGILSLLALMTGFPSLVQGQVYPTKPIRMLVGFPAGGGSADVAARVLSQKMSEGLGQQIIIDNRPGAGGAIASEIVAKAASDGYTLVSIGTSHAVNASLHKKLPFDSVKDFAAIVLVSSAPVVLTAHPAVPVNTVKELIAFARARPGELNYASAGTGGINHLAGELLKWRANINLTHVPYKGVAQALPPVMAGEVQLMFSSLPGALAQIRSGRVKAIAVTSTQRSSAVPEIPTMDESGVPGYEATSWSGILAPARTAKPIVEKLNAEAVKALRSNDVKEAFIRQGLDPRGSTPSEFEAHLKSEIAKWTKVILQAGIRPD